jgi:hypothetical protein
MRHTRPNTALAIPLALASVVALAACGSDSATDPSVARRLVIASGDSQTTVVATAAANPLAVRVLNGSGTGVAGVSITWTIGAGGGTLSATTDTTDDRGQAQVVYVPGTLALAGTVSATASGLAPVTFSLTLVGGSVASLATVGGDGAAALVGSTMPLTAKAEDRYGNAVAGVVIDWVAHGGSVSDATSTTDATGLARTTLTLGGTAGAYTVTADAPGLPPITFTVTGV